MDHGIDARIAARVRSLRAERSLTLDALAARSGVSRAMLSRVERGESSPTAGLLARLCDGLGITLAALLGGEAPAPEPWLARRALQPVWRDASGYARRAVSPAGGSVDVIEVELPAGVAVLIDTPDAAGHDRQIWVVEGALEVSGAGRAVTLGVGDCLRVPPGSPTGLRSAGPGAARCAVITGRGGPGAGPG